MESKQIGAWLRSINLSECCSTLVQSGYNKWVILESASWEDLVAVGLKVGHAKHIVKKVAERQLQFENVYRSIREDAESTAAKIRKQRLRSNVEREARLSVIDSQRSRNCHLNRLQKFAKENIRDDHTSALIQERCLRLQKMTLPNLFFKQDSELQSVCAAGVRSVSEVIRFQECSTRFIDESLRHIRTNLALLQSHKKHPDPNQFKHLRMPHVSFGQECKFYPFSIVCFKHCLLHNK